MQMRRPGNNHGWNPACVPGAQREPFVSVWGHFLYLLVWSQLGSFRWMVIAEQGASPQLYNRAWSKSKQGKCENGDKLPTHPLFRGKTAVSRREHCQKSSCKTRDTTFFNGRQSYDIVYRKTLGSGRENDHGGSVTDNLIIHQVFQVTLSYDLFLKHSEQSLFLAINQKTCVVLQ